MNTFFLRPLVIIMVTISISILVGCGSDDNNNDINDTIGCNNCFTFRNGDNPQTRQISGASYKLDEEDIILKFRTNNNENVIIYLENTNTNFNSIPEGTFTNNSSPIFFRVATHQEDDGDMSYSISSASRKATIKKEGSNFEIDFEFISGLGLTLGNYTGSILEE